MHALYFESTVFIDLLQQLCSHFVWTIWKTEYCGVTCEQLGFRYLFSVRQELLPEVSTGCNSSAAMLFSFLHLPSLSCFLETVSVGISTSEPGSLQTMHLHSFPALDHPALWMMQWSHGKNSRQLFIKMPFLASALSYFILFHCRLLAPGSPFFVYSWFSILNSSQYSSFILGII